MADASLAGRRFGHYHVLEVLGTGGMGEVYRARDERLGREVALKFLPPEREHDEAARRRLRLEARTLSRLNHPSIGAIYGLEIAPSVRGEGGGDDTGAGFLEFLVMELVAGPSVEERIADGPLAIEEAIEFARQTAEGLGAAHAEGIVHRDLKPANLRLTPGGCIKIIDFGIATGSGGPPVAGPEAETMTPLDPALGTLAYMAPEALLGGPIDARTDLYALGATLYEMVTGFPPFRAATAAGLVNAILNEPVRDPRELRPDLGTGLAAVILRAMARGPEERFATAAEFAAALGAAVRAVRSVAVLPLDNLSRDPEEEYIADGMTEGLIAGLARIGGLRVISRTSVMHYKGARPPLAEIARTLHVDYVVEGTVLRSGPRARVNARLIDVSTDRHLWAQSYDRDLGDYLALQEELSLAIAREIGGRIAAGGAGALPAARARRATSPEVTEAYLKGRFHWEKRSEEGLLRAIDCFRLAIERDPLHAPSYAGLADSYLVLSVFSLRASRECAMRARAAALRALEMDPALADAVTSLAAVADVHDWDRAEAGRLFRKAILLNPNYANAHHWFSDHLSSLARFEEAMEEVRRAEELDPLSTIISSSVGHVLYYARRYEESVEQFLRVLELDRGFPPSWRGLGGSLEMLGRFEEAVEALETAMRLSGGSSYSLAGLAHTHALSGNAARSREILTELTARAGQRYVSPYSLAAVHVALGEHDAAFELLDQALRDHDRALVWLPVSPRFDPLRGDPRIERFLVAVRGREGYAGGTGVP